MRCEACGRKILGKPFRVVIEGAKLMVCVDCSKHGDVIWEEEKPKPQAAVPGVRRRIPLSPIGIPKPKVVALPDANLELVEGYDAKIRQSREKLGISHEDLGKRLNEKVSLLRKIETGKMKPDNVLATKLERTLKVKLIVPASADKTKVPQSRIAKPGAGAVTLGDLIKLDPPSEKGEGEKT